MASSIFYQKISLSYLFLIKHVCFIFFKNQNKRKITVLSSPFHFKVVKKNFLIKLWSVSIVFSKPLPLELLQSFYLNHTHLLYSKKFYL